MDQHVHHVGLRIKAVVPDMLQNHGLGHDPASVPHQIFEQSKLPRLQLDLCPARVTSRVSRSMTKSPTTNRVGSVAWVARRISACTRASNSENANGLVR